MVSPYPYLTAGDGLIPALSITQCYKYLGILTGALGLRTQLRDTLQGWLDNISRVPLKPHQRLYLLRVNVIPKLYHQLVFGNMICDFLKGLDVMIRGALRSWLRIPRDAPVAFFHASYRDGGLSVPSLTYQIPLLKKLRLSRLAGSSDPIVNDMVRSSTFQKVHARWLRPVYLGDCLVNSKDALRKGMSTLLFRTIDGKGLSSMPETGELQSWIVDPEPGMSGYSFIGAIRCRGSLLFTRESSLLL